MIQRILLLAVSYIITYLCVYVPYGIVTKSSTVVAVILLLLSFISQFIGGAAEVWGQMFLSRLVERRLH